MVLTEVTVAGSLAVLRLLEVELPNHDTGPEVPVLADELDNLGVRDLSGSVRVNVDGQRLGNTDGVGELNEDTAGNATSDQGLG